MKFFWLLLLLLFLALGQAAWWPVNLVLLPVLGFAAFGSPRPAFIAAFCAGLFLDLATLGRLGSASLLLLFFSLLMVLYRRRFEPTHPLFLPLFCFLASLVLRRGFFWPEVLVLFLGSFLWRALYLVFFGRFEARRLQP